MRRPGKNERPWQPKREVALQEKKRERSRSEYHSWRWTKESREYRAAHPLCKRCKDKGVIQEAQVVDHIVPTFVQGVDFWDRNNWQSLCTKCNMEKGNEDKRKYRSRRGRGV